MPVERRGPTGVQCLRPYGRQGRYDNSAHQPARPAAEALRQGEGREGLAVLGPVCPRGQTGDLARGVRGGQAGQRRSGHRRGDVYALSGGGGGGFLGQLRDELVTRTYRPRRNRRVEIPKGGGKVRVLGIPAIRDRVVQGALKLILEPIFEADFHDGSY